MNNRTTGAATEKRAKDTILFSEPAEAHETSEFSVFYALFDFNLL